jgi:peptidoglycan/LPS O-acetylase OafA/YrhL
MVKVEANNCGAWERVMFQLALVLLPLLISFACGYGVREWISRRHRAAAREEYYARHLEKRCLVEAFHTPARISSPDRVGRFYLVDILRGAASLAVVVWHYQHFFMIAPQQLPSDFTRDVQPLYFFLERFYLYGFNAVQLFFVLSGFVFFSQYLNEIRSRQVGAWKFFVLRFSRLYPLQFVTLVFVASLQFVSQNIDGSFIVYSCNDFYHFVLNLFFASRWGLETCASFNAPTWSVSVEVLLYISFFLFALIAPRTLSMRIALMFLCVCVGVFFKKYASGSWSEIGFAIACFYVGGAVFLLLDLSVNAGCRPVHILIAAIGAQLAAFAIFAITPRFHNLLLYGIIFPGAIMVLAAAQYCQFQIGKGARVLGDISYSTYLTHFPIQLTLLLAAKAGLVNIDYHTRSAFLMFLALLIAVSVPIYYWFERPAQNYLRRSMLPAKKRIVSATYLNKAPSEPCETAAPEFGGSRNVVRVIVLAPLLTLGFGSYFPAITRPGTVLPTQARDAEGRDRAFPVKTMTLTKPVVLCIDGICRAGDKPAK